MRRAPIPTVRALRVRDDARDVTSHHPARWPWPHPNGESKAGAQ